MCCPKPPKAVLNDVLENSNEKFLDWLVIPSIAAPYIQVGEKCLKYKISAAAPRENG